MSLLGDIVGGIGSVAKGVVDTVGDVAGGAVHLAEGVAGEVAKVGAGVVGDLLQCPFKILSGAAQSVLGEVANATQGSSSSGAGSVFDKIFDLMQKLQGQLNDKVNSFDSNASPTDQQKALFDIQQIQSQITQLSSQATNIEKKDDDAKDNIISNLR